MRPRDLRICFIGDSFVNGVLDCTYQGWPGRICAAASSAADITLYNLGIRRDTSEDIARRWHEETTRRLPDGVDGRLVFSFGVNDCTYEGGAPRVPLSRSLELAEHILTTARATRPVLWVGPPPVSPKSVTNSNERIEALSTSYAHLAKSLTIPYHDLYGALIGNPEWHAAVQRGDGAHPDHCGYELIADSFLQWKDWQSWLAI